MRQRQALEHGNGEERLGGVEAKGDASQESEPSVGALDPGVAEARFEGRFDAPTVGTDRGCELDEWSKFRARSPPEPVVELRLGGDRAS